MKPRFIAKVLRVIAVALVIVICLGFVTTAQIFDAQEENISLLTYTLVFCIFIFTPLSLVFLCLGMAHLLEGNGDKK